MGWDGGDSFFGKAGGYFFLKMQDTTTNQKSTSTVVRVLERRGDRGGAWIGYAMVVFFFEDQLYHEYYSYECEDLERFRNV